MGDPDNTYSRVVAWLKILLPLAALAILSTLFLFSRQIDPSRAIPYADVDVEEMARDQRIGAPEYTGVTRDGAAISVSAASAQPDADNAAVVSATRIAASIDGGDGGHTELTAAEGRIDTTTNVLTASGGVRISASPGYVLETRSLTANLDRTDVVADGTVTATGPMGTLTSGGMRISPGNNSSAGGGKTASYVLVFNRGVRLIYDPGK